MRRTFPALAALLAWTGAAAADPVVVELFTSQGCSSCPPADALMADLADRDDIIPLAFHVDYWDWIGWTDTFGDPAHSARQRGYAEGAGSKTVYTPQFVVGGRAHVAGADGMALSETIAAQADATPDVLRVEGGALVLAPVAGGGRLLLVEVLPEAKVEILHGENAGRVVDYHRIVRRVTDLGAWDGGAGTVPLPPATAGHARVALAQAMPDGRPGPILGAVEID